MKVTPVVPIAGQNFPRHFKGYLEFFLGVAYFTFIYYIISREPSLENVLEVCLAQVRNQWLAAVNAVNK